MLPSNSVLHVPLTSQSKLTKDPRNATEDVGWLDSPSILDSAAKRLETVKALGLDAGVDFHGRIHKPMAAQLAKRLEPYQPLFIEEPLLSENPEAIADLARQTTIPIALGERLHSRWDMKPFLTSVAIFQPDMSHVGGISELRRMAVLAETYDAALAPHCPLGPLTLAAEMQVDAVSANFAIQEMSLGIHYNVGTEADLTSYVKNPEVFDVKGGFVAVPEGPGLGVEIDEEWVRRASAGVDGKGVKAWRSPAFVGANGEWREW
jgi:galactonate dehydratase